MCQAVIPRCAIRAVIGDPVSRERYVIRAKELVCNIKMGFTFVLVSVGEEEEMKVIR